MASQQAAALALDKLLLPTTAPEVRGRYHAFASRAQNETFGLLEQDIVMLDTETTGLSFRKDQLIEIAAARISGNKIVEKFETYVYPSMLIPAEIQVLTGITNHDVSNAPMPEEAVAALAEFVGGMPVVAHNASFDQSFIQKVQGGNEVTDTWIDSLALSRIALPRLASHRLADMAQAFGCAAVEHRAMADVEALCGMWRIMLVALSDLPGGVLDRMARMHEEVAWPLRPIFSYLSEQSVADTRSLRDVRRTLTAQREGHRRQDAMELLDGDGLGVGLLRVGEDEVASAFGPDGIASDMYDSYESRPEQVAMAQEVREALNTGTHRALEAGTGVGKSMAYLLPSVLFSQQNNVTVGVATKTNALTDQLVSEELPALDAALPQGVNYCSIKGYDHYPCLRKVELATVRELPEDAGSQTGDTFEDAASDILTALAVVMAFASQSADGDLDALGIRWRNVPRYLVTTAPTECMRTRCPFFPHECFIHGARRRAASADVVVTNHSLLLRNVALDGALLPPIRHWVVDEAHSFEQEARRQWAKELSADAANQAFGTLGGINTGVIHGIMTQIQSLDASTLVAGLLTKAAACVQRASVSSANLLACVHDLSSVAPPSGGYDSTTLWISEQVRMSDEWHALENAAAAASGSFEESVRSLDATIEALTPEAPQLASDLSHATDTLRELLDALRTIVLEPDDTYVYSAELYRAKRRMGRERLLAEKLDVGADLAESWYPEAMSVSYTSATMAVGQKFDHFSHAVGLDHLPKEKYSTMQFASSFDYDGHMSVVVARNMPAPTDNSYLSALEDLLFDVHRAMDGSVLTLFTNRREMEQVHRALRPRLQQIGLDVACQERGSSPRRLRERFMSDEQLSLFALKSFWEGFDAAGDTLRCVVIPRLPFASPRDPLVCERELREQRSWWRYSLPEAVLSVKQAAGRLIRSSTDTGVLVLADSRICTKRYGQTFLRALPSSNVSMLECENVGRYIDLWRASR